MYVIDFFQQTFRKSNISVIIYLVLNVFIIGLIVNILTHDSYLESVVKGLILYIISLAIALSPIGEWILRYQTGCKKIKRVDYLNFLMPIYKEVYEKAKLKDPSLADDIELYINNSEEVNAFATGRKTICITKGLMNRPVEQIKATLAHEFGHISHKDTDMLLFVYVGNFIVTTMILFIKLVANCFHAISVMSSLSKGNPAQAISRMSSWFLTTIVIAAFMWVWTKVGVLLIMKSSRDNEFEADKFAFDLGYGHELCLLLDTFGDVEMNGVFASLASSHPDIDDRIARLQSLGVYVKEDSLINKF